MSNRTDVSVFLKVAENANLNKYVLKDIYGGLLLFINNKETDTQLFLTKKYVSVTRKGSDTKGAQSLVISFRGSKQAKDWVTDFSAWHTTVPYGNYNSKIKVHAGFIKCYKSVRLQILRYLSEHKTSIDRIYITGHSLGGALALLCAIDIQYNYSSIPLTVYTSGAPAVGNKAFARSYNKRVPDTTRTCIRRDIVPKLPPRWLGLKSYGGYKHVKRKYTIGPKSFWAGLKYFFNIGGRFADKAINHSIGFYKEWC